VSGYPDRRHVGEEHGGDAKTCDKCATTIRETAMKPLKERGVEEARALRKRVVRAHAMGRTGKADTDYLVQRLNEVEARIISMQEYGEED
jgi:hypothetical protein